jgi:hypothetical protein
MGLFGDDNLQDARLDALEAHVRRLTEMLQENQIELFATQIAALALQAQIDEKVSADDVDPVIAELNTGLGQARERAQAAQAAASESWATLQDGAQSAADTMRASVAAARSRLQQG